MSFTKLCEKFMLLSNSGRKKMIPPPPALECMTNPQRPGQYCACSVSPAQINTVTGSIPLSLSSGGLQQHGSAKVSHERKHGETCLRVKFQALASLTSPPLVSANSLRFNSSSEMRGNVDIQTLTFRASTDQTKCAR